MLPAEISKKEHLVREFLASEGLDVMYLTLRSNFAWITAGRTNHITFTDLRGVGTLAITLKEKFLVSDGIEKPRLMAEELDGLGYEPKTYPWQEGEIGFAKTLHAIAGAGQKGMDAPLPCTGSDCEYQDKSKEFKKLRFSLMPEEIERFRQLGQDTAAAMDTAIRSAQPGMTEVELAALMAREQLAKGIAPNLLLVASDERIERFRHPVATEKRIGKSVMLVTCAHRGGLIINNTRIVHFGAVPPEIRKRHKACCQVQAALVDATTPGTDTAALWQVMTRAYADAGFADEWKNHHQGGAAGYEGRDWFLNETTHETVQENQAFAWNPSITGAKAEETFIATSNGPQMLTETPGWPTVEVSAGGNTYRFADILEIPA